jgi:hypothetical protein
MCKKLKKTIEPFPNLGDRHPIKQRMVSKSGVPVVNQRLFGAFVVRRTAALFSGNA